MGRIATLILAGGFSTRMQESFKPLLPLNFSWPRVREVSALEVLVELYTKSGIKDIFIVIGTRKQEELTNTIAEINTRFQSNMTAIYNKKPERGMFSSICEGAKILESKNDFTHFFVQPVDMPLIRPCTIHMMLKAVQTCSNKVIIPKFKNLSGHPPLIPTQFIKQILNDAGHNGLRAILSSLPQQSIATADSNITLGMNTPEEYTKMQEQSAKYHILDVQEALELLHCFNVSKQGIMHAQSVACVASAFAKKYTQLNANSHIDIELTTVGALLHDMCKHEPKHEQAVGKVLRELGLFALAPLVEEHNDCQLDKDLPVTEKELIYLADKYICGKELVPMQQRFEQKLTLYAHIPEACLAIKSRLKRAKTMEERVANELGIAPYILAKQALQVFKE